MGELELDHLGRGVAAKHVGSSLDQLGDVCAWPAAGVQDTAALDVTYQVANGRPVVESVVRRRGGVPLILRGE